MAVVDDESYSDDGSWCEIGVNNDDDNESVDSFERVDYIEDLVNYMTELFSTSSSSSSTNVIDDQLRVPDHDDLVTKSSDVQLVIVDDELDSKDQQGNDKPESVEDNIEAKVATAMFSPFIRDKYNANEIIPDVFFGGKTLCEDKDELEFKEQGNDKPESSVEDNEAKVVPTAFSPPGILFGGGKTRCEAKDELDDKVKSKEQAGNDKPESVEDNEDKPPVAFSPFIRDKYNANEIIPDDVLFGGKTQCETKDAKVPFDDDDEELGELIKKAQLQLEKKKRTRDLFRAQIALQEWRVRCHNDALNAASKKVMVARELVELKEHEIHYVKNVIKRFRNIVVVEDIDIKILKLEKRIQYEIMPLLDERKLIREINQLRRIRDMGSWYEIQEALDKKEHIDELVEDLRDELEVLQDDVSKAEKAAEAVKKTYEKAAEIEEEMWAQYKAIQDSREEASVYLEGLKKRLDGKKIDFLMHDESLRAHGEEETKKEEIDAILKDLRDLEEEVCNDARMGVTPYFYSPPGHQVISQYPYFQPTINMPVERQKHDVNEAQMQAEQWAQKEAEKKAKANSKPLKRKERKRVKSCINGTDVTILLAAALYCGALYCGVLLTAIYLKISRD